MSRSPASRTSRRQAPGWATGSLVDSIDSVVLRAVVVWQVLMTLFTLASAGLDEWLLALAQVALGGLALACAVRGTTSYLVPGGLSALGLWAMLSSGDLDAALTFAAAWQINIASMVAGLSILHLSYSLIIVGQSALTTAVLLLVLPEWGPQVPVSIVVTQTLINIAFRWGTGSLLALSAAIDGEVTAAEDEERRTRVARHLSATIAEESRVLHDTAINTLGSIANGAAHLAGVPLVREQCARDAALLQSLHSEVPLPLTSQFSDLIELSGIPVERSGLDDAAVAQLTAQLPDRTVAGVVGCVREALTNAAKHSRAGHADVDVRTEGQDLVIVVRDDGVGFAGPAPAGRGIDTSIVGRSADAGFDAQVRSVVGDGTTVTLTVPLHRPPAAVPDPDDGGSLQHRIAVLIRRAGLLGGVGLTAVSLALTLAGGTNRHGALYPMVAIMAVACAVTWPRVSGRVRIARDVLLIGAGAVVFFLSAAATDFGSDGAIHWQALAAAGPFILLISTRPRPATVVAGVVCWVGVILALAVRALGTSTVAAEIVIVAGCAGVAFFLAWVAFQRLIVAVGSRSHATRRRMFAARLDADLVAAAQSSYRRWLGAGLDSAVRILQRVARGDLDPRDPQARTICGDEERYLRQLVLVSPELVHLGDGLMAGLRQSRARGVQLRLRVGDSDAPDEPTAHRITAALQAGIASVPPDSTLTATIFPVNAGLQLTLSGHGLGTFRPDASSIRVEHLGPLDLMELTFAVPDESRRVGAR